MAALSFCYAPPLSGQYIQYVTDDENSTTLSNLEETCQKVMTSRGCQISVLSTKSKNTPNIDYNLSLTGSAQALMEARGDLLLNCPLEIKLTLQIPPPLTIASDLFQKLEKELDTKITVIPEKEKLSSLSSDNPITIEIVGNPIQVEQCRVRVLVLLDEIQKSFKTEIVRLPLKLQYLICGRKRAGLLPIIEETSTNIYFPSPFVADTLQVETDTTSSATKDETSATAAATEPAIYITGEPNHVSRVKDMLNKLAVQKAKSMYHKDTALYARKIDWLLLHRRDELRKIMHDNGAYIEFPPLGSGDNRVTVYAENRVNAERTLRALNFQACNIYEACFYFNNRDGSIYDSTGSHTFFDSTSNLSSLVTQLSQVSGSEVIYKTDPGCIEVLGAERAIRNVYQRLQEMQFLQVFHQYTIFRVESSNEQRDFISGKKNGKINKIMKTSGAKIRFMPFINDYNFIIEVESTSFTKALDGLTLLQEELPAEISFYVPESYHKRIIGVGGKNIQRIMKKYGVYVKFSNTEEFASLGGYYNNEDNVVARTPMKNQINLDNLRHAVMELIHPKDRDYIIESIRIPFRFHRDMIHDYQDSFITEELIKKTNTHVLWPDAELANNNVELLGPEAHMSLAFKMMESIVPESFDLHAPLSTEFSQAVQSDKFQEQVVQPLLQEHNIIVNALSNKSNSADSNTEKKEDGLIRLNLKRDQLDDTLRNALDMVIRFLKSENVELYEKTSADELFAKVKKAQPPSFSKSSHHHLLESTSSLLNQPTSSSSSVLGGGQHQQQSSVSMMRSSNDTVFTSNIGSNINTNNNPSPPQAYQFFNFHNNDTTTNTNTNSSTTTTSNNTNNNTNNPLVDPSNWTPLHMQQGPIPSVTTSGQSNGSNNDNNIRAIFDAPLDLTEQERAVLSNYRYQRMSMPPASNFGFPQAVPSATNTGSGGDIWSTPSQINRRSTGFTAGNMTSPPSSSRNTYSANASSDGMQQMRMFNEGSNSGFYPSMMQQNNSSSGGGDFNPYSDANTGSLKSSQSMPEPMLEAHFKSGRPPYQTSPNSFHHNLPPAQFSQMNLGTFTRQSNPGGGFVNNNLNDSPEHNHQAHQFYPSNDEMNVVHSMLDFPTIPGSAGSSGFDPRRQPNNNNQDGKGSRPPPGIDL